MEVLQQVMRATRPQRLRTATTDRRRPAAMWRGDEFLDGRPERFLAVVLTTPGCRVAAAGGCSYCGYYNDTALAVTEEDLRAQWDMAGKAHQGEAVVKVYTSGSFFDAGEVPATARRFLLEGLRDLGSKRVVLESLPAYLTDDALREAASILPHLEIAIGLESASPAVLHRSMNKGYVLDGFLRRAPAVRAAGLGLRAYLMLRPAFLTERESLEDVAASAEVAGRWATTVSINATNIQAHTLVEDLFRRGLFRPPWLWTALEAVARVRSAVPAGTNVVCSPTAAGTRRGAHNCGICDHRVHEALRAFSANQDPRLLDVAPCACREEWLDALSWEGLVQSPAGMHAVDRSIRSMLAV